MSQRFKYGLKGLDEQSIFVVTSDEASSNMMLELYSDKINIPVMKKYTLKVKKEDLNNLEWLEANFAIFKQKDKYYVISLADHQIKKLLVDKPKAAFNIDNIVRAGDVRELTNGDIIHTGESVWESSGDKHKFVFNRPKNFSLYNTEEYLDVKRIDTYNDFNKRTITALNQTTQETKSINGVTFNDIGGLDNRIETLKKYVVRTINYLQVYQSIRLNKCILLYEPPRYDKTLPCKAMANETSQNTVNLMQMSLKTQQ